MAQGNEKFLVLSQPLTLPCPGGASNPAVKKEKLGLNLSPEQQAVVHVPMSAPPLRGVSGVVALPVASIMPPDSP